MAGLVPAMRMADANPNDALKQGLGRTDASAGGRTTRNALVVAEVALSLTLLIGAGLMIRSLWSLHGVDPGFEMQSVATMSISVPAAKFADATQQTSFYEEVSRRVQTLPGVEAVGLVDDLPLSGGGSHQPIAIEGQPAVPMSEQPEVDVRVISAGYMSAMRTPIVRGRDFNDSDVMGRPAVALISQSMANRFWPNQDPIGKHLTITFAPSASREIIGIVKDVKLDALNETRPNATLYTPITQVYPEAGAAWRSFGMTLVARAEGNPNNLVTSIKNAIHQIDPDRPVLDVKTMEDVVAESLSPQRFNMLLLAAFAGLALLLAAVGIYSVLAYAVRHRVREIGLRMALGAQIGDVLRLVVVEGMKPTMVGLVIGILGALALGRVLSSMIFGVSIRDVTTYASVSVLMVGAALFASLIPAWHATKVDSIRSLRDE